MNLDQKLAILEVKRARMHEYLIMKLGEKDYHAVADAAMDLREIECTIKVLNEKETDESNKLYGNH